MLAVSMQQCRRLRGVLQNQQNAPQRALFRCISSWQRGCGINCYSSRRFLSTQSTNPVAASGGAASVNAENLFSERTTEHNLNRLRELLQEVGHPIAATLLQHQRPPRRKEVWPPVDVVPLPDRPSADPAVTSTSVSSTPKKTPKYSSAHVIKTFQKQHQQEKQQQQQQQRESSDARIASTSPDTDPLRWYGGPPGVIQEVDYFTAAIAATWNAHFHQHYYAAHQPTAPLLRCPACAAHLLTSTTEQHARTPDRLSRYARAPTSRRLWLDPVAMDRHLSWAHADQLFSPQELRAYNAQVQRELRYSCGLASLTECGVDADVPHPMAEVKQDPAQLVLAVDVANLEIGSAQFLLDVLNSTEVTRILSRVPVALCATQELFIPFTAKVLHMLYQLARLHPASTLHVFAANTSLESGDLLMAGYINELIIAGPPRATPPILLLTRDGQQRRVAKEMHGVAQRTLSPTGIVQCASVTSVSSLEEGLRAALTANTWLV